MVSMVIPNSTIPQLAEDFNLYSIMYAKLVAHGVFPPFSPPPPISVLTIDVIVLLLDDYLDLVKLGKRWQQSSYS